MTEHPDDALAAYLDGELDATERAAVDEHLAGCERCRQELRLATEGRDALRAIPELDAPPGIPLAVRRAGRSEPSPIWRRVGVAAVAAGVIAAGALAVSTIDFSEEQAGGGAGGGGQRPAAPEVGEPEAAGGQGAGGSAPAEDVALSGRAAPAPRFTETDKRYDAASLPAVGRRYRDQAREAMDAGLAPTVSAFFDEFDIGELEVPARQAYRCVLTEVPPDQPVVPFAIEGATFEGTPAYVAAFLQGPAPDQPYDRVLIWVVDRETCSLLSLASQRL